MNERRSGRQESRQGGEVSGKQRRCLVCAAGHRHHPSRNKPEGSEKIFSFWLPVGIRAPQGCAEEASGVPRRQSEGKAVFGCRSVRTRGGRHAARPAEKALIPPKRM